MAKFDVVDEALFDLVQWGRVLTYLEGSPHQLEPEVVSWIGGQVIGRAQEATRLLASIAEREVAS